MDIASIIFIFLGPCLSQTVFHGHYLNHNFFHPHCFNPIALFFSRTFLESQCFHGHCFTFNISPLKLHFTLNKVLAPVEIVNFQCHTFCSSILLLVYFNKRSLIPFLNLKVLNRAEKYNSKIVAPISGLLFVKISKKFTRNNGYFHFIRALQRQTSRCA